MGRLLSTKSVQPVEVMISPGCALEPAVGRWFVLHTLSRQEKALSSDLSAMGISYFLPLVRRIRTYGKRRIEKKLPLFPGYVFIKGSLEQAYQADRSVRVAKLIEVRDQKRLDSELKQLRKALSQGDRTEFEDWPYLQEGNWVEVRSGPFKGVQGMIEDKKGGGRLILQVQMLGKATSFELDGAIVERIDREA